jgi:signal recognition particle subunit SRP19
MDVGSADLRSSIKKWKIIYPVYLNSKKTVAEGRRIAAAKACPDPTCIEIADSCAYLKIPGAIEVSLSFPLPFCWHLAVGDSLFSSLDYLLYTR